jgi:HD-GYP domain-containing protein (c-di-GMP phosphodiesterase class II)
MLFQNVVVTMHFRSLSECWGGHRRAIGYGSFVKYFIKRYALLLVAQAVCLAMGLWLQQRFVHASAPKDGQHSESVSQSGNAKTAAAGSVAKTPPAAGKAAGPAMSTTAITMLAFLWIAGLQTAVAYLILMRDQEEVSRKHSEAESVSLRQYNELLRTRDAVIYGLARLTESRDLETGNHLERISVYSTRLASAARRDPQFAAEITAAFIKLIGISSVLHDIGKVGIRDSILLKPGRLERHERPLMQLHSAIGGKCIREIESRLGKSNFLAMAREIAFNHHERWDGLGYPKGLAGDEIPLAARIVAIADVYDALSTKRIYRDALPHEKCVEMIRSQAGKQFDPGLVEIFLKLEAEFREIAQNCRDGGGREETRPTPAVETLIAAVESEASIEEKFATLQAALDLCADEPPSSTASQEGKFPSAAESTGVPASSARTSELGPSTGKAEKEPEHVA